MGKSRAYLICEKPCSTIKFRYFGYIKKEVEFLKDILRIRQIKLLTRKRGLIAIDVGN